MKFNQDQFLSLVRSILKIAGSALTAHGLTQAASWVNSEDVTGVIITLAGLFWSHWEHSPDAPTTPPPAGANTTAIFLAILIPSLFLFGCNTTPQTAAYRAAGITQVSVETAMREFNQAAKAGLTTPKQNAMVKTDYIRYQNAFATMCDAGAAYSASGGTNQSLAASFQYAAANSTQTLGDLFTLIQSFGITLTNQ